MSARVVHFFSDGLRLEADFHVPEKPGPHAAIVLCHGFSGMRHQSLPVYAELFVKAGYAVLAFDYRGFGGSEGEAGRIIPHEQVEDIRSALTWLETQPEIDAERLGIWGMSNGGAHIVQVAGIDTRVKCVVGMVGYGDGFDLVMRHKSPAERAALLARFHQDRIQRITSGRSERVSVLELVGSAQSRAYMTAGLASTPDTLGITLQSGEAALGYRPVNVAADIAPRALLLIGADQDDVCPADRYKECYERAKEPKRWVSFPIGHYEVYAGEWFERTTAEAVAWFDRHLWLHQINIHWTIDRR